MRSRNGHLGADTRRQFDPCRQISRHFRPHAVIQNRGSARKRCDWLKESDKFQSRNSEPIFDGKLKRFLPLSNQSASIGHLKIQRDDGGEGRRNDLNFFLKSPSRKSYESGIQNVRLSVFL